MCCEGEHCRAVGCGTQPTKRFAIICDSKESLIFEIYRSQLNKTSWCILSFVPIAGWMMLGMASCMGGLLRFSWRREADGEVICVVRSVSACSSYEQEFRSISNVKLVEGARKSILGIIPIPPNVVFVARYEEEFKIPHFTIFGGEMTIYNAIRQFISAVPTGSTASAPAPASVITQPSLQSIEVFRPSIGAGQIEGVAPPPPYEEPV